MVVDLPQPLPSILIRGLGARIHVVSRHACVAPKLVQVSTVAWIAASFPIKFRADLIAECCELKKFGDVPEDLSEP
jgi:hypothetical protein